LDAIFYDRRRAIKNRGTDVYYTYSTDGGRTFARNARLTSKNFDSQIGPLYANISARRLPEFGGRLGLASENSGAVAAWMDTRNTARGVTAQDVFSSVVTLPDSGLTKAAGVAFALAGLAGIAASLIWRRRVGVGP